MRKGTNNRKRSALLAILSIIPLGTVCSQSATSPVVQTENITNVSVILFAEQEAGIDPYPVRLLTSPDYVRIDDGYDESDYVLFDRRTHTVFSVSHDEHSILEIRNHPVSGPLPPDLSLTEIPIVDKEAPTIAGKQPQQFEYLANGNTCYQSISVSGLLDEAVAGMAEYAVALGERQLNNMQSVPETMRTPCFLSRYVYAPGRHYTHGLPVQVWDDSGYNRSLTDFRTGETVRAALFSIPDNYERMLLGE
jgi:hypothetical protein